MRVDKESGSIMQRIENVGTMVHGLVAWQGVFVMLDSGSGKLITLDPVSKLRTVIWQVCEL